MVIDSLGNVVVLRGGQALLLAAPPRDLTVVTFPADDAVFAERVDELVSQEVANDEAVAVARRLEHALRGVHPRVATSVRDGLAGFGDRVLYVFRDGSARSDFDSDEWTRDDAIARVVTDANGRYVEANDAAERLFGVSRDIIVGASAGTFTRPDARIKDGPALWRALARTGRLHSLSVVRRGDGSEVSVEFVSIRDGDRPETHVTYLRELT